MKSGDNPGDGAKCLSFCELRCGSDWSPLAKKHSHRFHGKIGTTGDAPFLFCNNSIRTLENRGAKVRHWSRMDWDPVVPHTKL